GKSALESARFDCQHFESYGTSRGSGTAENRDGIKQINLVWAFFWFNGSSFLLYQIFHLLKCFLADSILIPPFLSDEYFAFQIQYGCSSQLNSVTQYLTMYFACFF